MRTFRAALSVTCLMFMGVTAFGDVAGKSAGAADLVIAAQGKSPAAVVVSPSAGEWEKRAAADLATYIGRMIGGEGPKLVGAADGAAEVLKGAGPVLVVGRAALDAEPSLKDALAKVAKAEPLLRADAVVVRRVGNRVYLAGTNDESHYYAAVELLRRWGCRWYLPTEIGECIPRHAELRVGEIDYAYAPPFEVRKYWLSWNGDTTGKAEFQRRNFGNDIGVPNGHILATYTKDLIPKGKTMFNVPIAEESTAEHVAKQVLPIYASGKDVQLGLEDGVYESDSPKDKELIALQYDKYFLTQSYTDAFLTMYNGVAERLMKAAPQSKAHIGFLIYSNITLPPVKIDHVAKPLVGYLAPIDIDPIHGMDDPRSGPRREYKDMLYKWAKLMPGRIVIYDYDQSMLVWRDIPNPSHQAFRQDVKHYRAAGIAGVDTESRGAMATIFLNLFFRGQLLWDPDADVDAMLAEFYPKFYGPAAKPMGAYWGAIYKAWADTIATEHEYFVAPAVYTPELVATLKAHLEAAEAAARDYRGDDAKLIADRMRFTRLGFEVLEAYTAVTHAANTEADYAAAVAAGERGLATREKLTEMNGTFTTYKRIGEAGYAWWPGEVKQYKELLPFTDGTKGTLVAKLPLLWDFRRDPDDVGVKEAWFGGGRGAAAGAKWEQLRSDLYMQAQGVVTPDAQGYTGHAWYRANLDLAPGQEQGKLHVKFPGLFNECWLYVNGQEIAHRPFKGVWWMNDYRFEWDVDVSGKLKAGVNDVVVRVFNPHHMGGMFRRPFVYREK